MQNRNLFLIVTIALCFTINGSVNQTKLPIFYQPGVYQDELFLKVSVYLKDKQDSQKKYLCNQAMLKGGSGAFWDKDDIDVYVLFCPDKDLVQYGIGKVSRNPYLSLSFNGNSKFITDGNSKFVTETTKYQSLRNNKVSFEFEKDNFVFECERVMMKVPVQEPTEKK